MAALLLLAVTVNRSGCAMKIINDYQPVDLGITFETPLNLAGTLQNSVAGPLSILIAAVFGSILIIGLFSSNKISKHRSLDSSMYTF